MTPQRVNGVKVISLDEIASLKKPVCAFKGCPFHGIYKPILLVRHDENSAPLKIELDLQVCGLHSRNVGPEDYLGNKGWEIICAMLPPNIAKPERKLTKLEFELAI